MGARPGCAVGSGADCGPEDMHNVQAYDDYPVIVAMQLADLGFCAKPGPARIHRGE